MNLRMTRKKTLIVGGAAVAVLGGALPALAFWTFSPSHPTGSYTAATLAKNSSVTVPQYSSGSVGLSWASVTAPDGTATTYVVQRVKSDNSTAWVCGTDGTTTPPTSISATSCNDTSVPAGAYTYQVSAVFHNWLSNAQQGANAVVVDTTPPSAPALTVGGVTGANTYADNTNKIVYVNNHSSGNSGSFTVSATTADADSQIQKVNFPTITGVTGGGDVSTPSAGAYGPVTYTWSGTLATTNFGNQTITSYNNAGLTNTATFALTSDLSAPTNVTVSYPAGYYTSLSVPITLSTPADTGSGVGSTAVLRDETTQADGTCGTFPGTFATTVTLSSGADTSVVNGKCYQYEFRATDRVGNSTTTAPGGVAKVDTTGPTLTGISSVNNGGGATNGTVEVGDQLTFTFSEALATLASTSSNMTITRGSGSAHAFITISGLTNTTFDVGDGGYAGTKSTQTDTGTLSLSADKKKVTFTVRSIGACSFTSGGSCTLTAGALVTPGAIVPASSITDLAGNAATGTFTPSSAIKLF